MKTAIAKLTNRIEKVEQNGGGSSSGGGSSNIDESQVQNIVDSTLQGKTINEYVSENKYTCDITPDESIFTFNDEPEPRASAYEGRCSIEFNNSITFTLTYKEQTFELTSD